MKFEGTFKLKSDHPDIICDSFVNYEKDHANIYHKDGYTYIEIKEDDERLYRKSMANCTEKMILSSKTIDFCLENDKL